MNIANGPHENAEELMTHKELMATRSDNVITQKSAKLNAGLEVLKFSQKRGKSLVQSDYDVIECGDSDKSEENVDEDASDTSNRHGEEPTVRIGAKNMVRAKCGAVALPRKKVPHTIYILRTIRICHMSYTYLQY